MTGLDDLTGEMTLNQLPPSPLFWLQWLLGGLLYYQTSYINIVIIYLPMFISACPLRQYLFFLYYAGCVSTIPGVQHCRPGGDLSSREPLGSQEGTSSSHFCKWGRLGGVC